MRFGPCPESSGFTAERWAKASASPSFLHSCSRSCSLRGSLSRPSSALQLLCWEPFWSSAFGLLRKPRPPPRRHAVPTADLHTHRRFLLLQRAVPAAVAIPLAPQRQLHRLRTVQEHVQRVPHQGRAKTHQLLLLQQVASLLPQQRAVPAASLAQQGSLPATSPVVHATLGTGSLGSSVAALATSRMEVGMAQIVTGRRGWAQRHHQHHGHQGRPGEGKNEKNRTTTQTTQGVAGQALGRKAKIATSCSM